MAPVRGKDDMRSDAAVVAAGGVDAVASSRRPTAEIETFLAEVERRAYRFALYELRDREAALDAVQDSMWRLVERYVERPANEWPALFFTILRNRTIDAKRWRALERLRGLFGAERRHDDDIEPAWMTAPAPAHETPEARLTRTQQRQAIEHALGGLPARQRQVFLLREWQGLSTAETAQVLGCSAGAVKQHHFRALQALRGKLSEVWHESA